LYPALSPKTAAKALQNTASCTQLSLGIFKNGKSPLIKICKSI